MTQTKQVALWVPVYERLKKRKTHDRQALSEVIEKLLDKDDAGA
jgi:predicted CopG family antitoxin